MKAFIALAMLAAGTAFAGTSFNFAAATDGTYVCGTYCSGFTTDNPAYAVDYVNMVYSSQVAVTGGWTNGYTITISVNGVPYKAINAIYVDVTPFTAKAADGSTITSTVKYNAVRLGCGRNCTRTAYRVTGGTVTVN